MQLYVGIGGRAKRGREPAAKLYVEIRHIRLGVFHVRFRYMLHIIWTLSVKNGQICNQHLHRRMSLLIRNMK